MVFKCLFINVVWVFWAFASVFSQTLTVTAFGETQEMARDNALAEMAGRIAVNVVAENQLAELETGDSFTETFTRNIISRSELPIYGAVFDYQRTASGIRCDATLDADEADRLYRKEIEQRIGDMQATTRTGALSDLSLIALQELQVQLEVYRKILVVARYFDVSPLPKSPVTLSDIQVAILAKAESVNSMSDLVGLVQRQLKDKAANVFVYPPQFEGSEEITSFAKTLRDRISGSLNSVNSLNNSSTILKGSYRSIGEQLELVLRLQDPSNTTISGITFKLNKPVYSAYKWRPESNSLDQLIKDGVVLSADLRVDLSTNKGKSDLWFKEGETIEILVKANRASYIYIIGHNTTEGNKFSYLLPFGDGESKRDMILFVNADDANKWISLGEFEVSPPFGVERLQAFASSTDPLGSIPDFYWNDDGYPEIGKDPNAVVVQTRGLVRKKKKSKSAAAEAVLNFTTME